MLLNSTTLILLLLICYILHSRLAVPLSQKQAGNPGTTDEDILFLDASIYAEKPQKDIHSFIGKFSLHASNVNEESLSIENTMWSNTIVASGTALGVIGKNCVISRKNCKPEVE